MNVKSLREALGEVGTRLSPSELALLDSVLRPLDNMTVNELCAKLAKIKMPKCKTEPSANLDTVSRYLDELKSARNDTTAFKAVLERVKADRRIKVRDASLLAQSFLDDQRDYKSKPVALKAIAARQFADERVASRKEKVSGIF